MEELVDFDTEELAQDVHPPQNRGSVIEEEDEFSQC
jgi:hypothetical protein